MAKLNASQVNDLKAAIEGNSLVSLYNRLTWDEPKCIRLSLEEKDTLQSMLHDEFTDFETKLVIYACL